jgi:hypothetical protein
MKGKGCSCCEMMFRIALWQDNVHWPTTLKEEVLYRTKRLKGADDKQKRRWGGY